MRRGAVEGELLDGVVRITLYGYPSAADLESLGRALWAAHVRRVLGAAGLTREPAPLGWRAEAYVRGRAGIVAEGRSRDGGVTIEARELGEFRVSIAKNAEKSDIEEAARELIASQRAQIQELKRSIWSRG